MRAFITACALTGALAGWSCGASAPTSPSATIAAVRILYGRPEPIDSFSASLYAYAIDSDGGYTDVTASALFSLSDPAAGTVSPQVFIGGRQIEFRNPGDLVEVRASYAGVVGHLRVATPARRGRVYPHVALRDNSGGTPPGIGGSLTVDADYTPTALQFSTRVTNLVTWTSTDPSIATIDRGVVRGVNIGTTQVLATYGGATGGFLLSVLPRQGRP